MRLILWAFSIAVVGLLVAYMIANQNFKSSASEAVVPDDSINLPAGQTQKIKGAGALRVKCGNTLASPPASFNIIGTIPLNGRASIVNSSNPQFGASVAVTGFDKSLTQFSKTLLPGQGTNYLYPGTLHNSQGSFTADLTQGVSFCNVVVKGFGDATVTAIGSSLTVEIYGRETTSPLLSVNNPIPLQTTLTIESCPVSITIKGDGPGPAGNEANQVVGTITIPALTQTGTINGYHSYKVGVTDPYSDNLRATVINKNKDNKLEITKKCDGNLTVVQPPKPVTPAP